MGESYDCETCGLEFNFRIKLRRHLVQAHGGQEEAAGEADILLSGARLSNQQKIQYFNTLKDKYKALTEEIASEERKFEQIKQKLQCSHISTSRKKTRGLDKEFYSDINEI